MAKDLKDVPFARKLTGKPKGKPRAARLAASKKLQAKGAGIRRKKTTPAEARKKLAAISKRVASKASTRKKLAAKGKSVREDLAARKAKYATKAKPTATETRKTLKAKDASIRKDLAKRKAKPAAAKVTPKASTRKPKGIVAVKPATKLKRPIRNVAKGLSKGPARTVAEAQKRNLSTFTNKAGKKLAAVTKEQLTAWEKKTGKKGLRAYLNANK